MSEFLILVDNNDKQWGKLEKELVHTLGILHRAFSVFIFNTKGELMLQQRADSKYHSGGLWTNTCCSHPRFGEDLEYAVPRRLIEEMGLDCETTFMFSFMYNANFDNGLIENEFDHVYFGITDEMPNINPEEVKAWKYVDLETLKTDIEHNPQNYTAWMKICLPQVVEHFKEHSKN